MPRIGHIPILFVLAAIMLLGTASQALAYPTSVERWRPVVRKELKARGCYSRWAENKAMHIMYRESRGRPKARNGQYAGLYQFGRGWVRSNRDWRYSPHSAIRRFVKGYDLHGARWWRQHWASTYY